MKPVVHYDPSKGSRGIELGHHAIIYPVDHTSPLVSNTKPVVTSKVMVVFGDGEFTTENTHYIPVTDALWGIG